MTGNHAACAVDPDDYIDKGRTMGNKLLSPGIALVAVTLIYSLAIAQDSFVAGAKRYTALVSRPNPPWDGPTTGPSARRNKSVIYVSAGQDNGGARGVGQGAAMYAVADSNGKAGNNTFCG